MPDAAMIEFACPHCGHAHRASREFVGRRSLCASCRSVVAIPSDAGDTAVGAGRSDAALEAAISDGGVSPWEVAFARAVVAQGADELAVATAMRARRATGGRMSSLPTMLTARGVTDAEASRRAMVAARRTTRGAASVAADEQFEECPNCFSFLATRDRACPYCGQRRAEDGLLEMCPNCKAEQPGGSPHCASCGADMRSGLLPARPATGPPASATMHTPPARASRRRRPNRTAMLGTILSYAAALLLVAGVVGGIWAFGHRDELVHGRSGAALNRSVTQFSEALRYGDSELVASLIDPAARVAPEAVAAVLPAVTGGDPGQEVLSIECQPPRVEGSSASVYAEVVLKRPDATLSEENAIEGLETVNALTGRASTNAKRLTWKWLLREGKWYYAGPLS